MKRRGHIVEKAVLACVIFVAEGGSAAAQEAAPAAAPAPNTIAAVVPPQLVPKAEAAIELKAVTPAAGAPVLTHSAGTSTIHVLPLPNTALEHAKKLLGPAPAAPAAPAAPLLLYHAAGPVMLTATIYTIFWEPAKLQNGGSTSIPAAYRDLQNRHLRDYPAHGIDNNNTQYSETLHGVTRYVENIGHLADTYIDHRPYPASGCTDPQTPGNCLTDAQIQAEIEHVVKHEHWKRGLEHIVFMFTSSGEGSCFSASTPVCAYTFYCAYHGFIPGTGAAPPIIYANMPYGDPAVCQLPGQPSPNADPIADTTTTAASHELTEAITDPLLNAWFTAGGAEIGDLCAYNYGSNTWDSGKANQMWNGHFYELQQEYDNHTAACVQVGP